MRQSKKSAGSRSERLESRRLFAVIAADGWASIANLPQAKGLTADLNLNAYKPYTLNRDSIAHSLSLAPTENVGKFGIGRGADSRLITIPTPDGGYARFRIVQSSIMAAALAAKFPNIKTYAGYGVDDPSAYIRLDLTPLGFHAQVLSPNGAYYVDPYYHLNQSAYVSYYGSDDQARPVANLGDDVTGTLPAAGSNAGRSTNNGGSTVSLRTYRLAVAATGEYTAAVGGGTVAGGQAAIVTAINRVTGIYETELAIRLTLVANNNLLVYTNASTDPYSNTSPNSLLTQNQATVDSVIGSANYDIGHVFSTGGGGLAGLGVVGNSSRKAQAETGLSNPTGDAFYVDYVAHEMGHEFGGNHTFDTSQDSNRNDGTAYEPGSGSTIMAYAGIEGAEDLQPHSDPYFAWKSIDEILTYVDVTVPTVGTRTTTSNIIPTVSGGANYTIPASTPFTLTATGSDPNGDTVYYSWEEADLGANTTGKLASAGDDGSSPLFRDYSPTTSPSRTFPQLASILAGATTTSNTVRGGGASFAEQLPTTSRGMKFVITGRDEKAGSGGTNVLSASPVTITSVAAASSFAISDFNSATTVAGNSAQTLTWNVAGTTGNGINTANVSLLMSTDGGLTFPTVLAASTANDGSEVVTIPNTASSSVRIKVAAVGNTYFDINNANITVTAAAAVSATPGVPDLLAATDSGVSSADNLTNRNNSSAAKTLQFTVGGTVNGAAVSILADGVVIGTATASGASTTVTTNGTTTLAEGVRNITAVQTETGKTVSPASAGLPITIDTIAPTFTAAPQFQYITTKPQVVYTLSENAATVADPIVTRNSPTAGTAAPTTSFGTSTIIVNFPSSPNGIIPDGNYTITTAANSISDAAGNTLAATSSLNFFYLAGDLNHDGIVDIGDLGTLAQNWQKTGLTFAQGDINYDGIIDIADLGLLAQNWQKTVSTSSALVASLEPTTTDSIPALS